MLRNESNLYHAEEYGNGVDTRSVRTALDLFRLAGRGMQVTVSVGDGTVRLRGKDDCIVGATGDDSLTGPK